MFVPETNPPILSKRAQKTNTTHMGSWQPDIDIDAQLSCQLPHP